MIELHSTIKPGVKNGLLLANKQIKVHEQSKDLSATITDGAPERRPADANPDLLQPQRNPSRHLHGHFIL